MQWLRRLTGPFFVIARALPRSRRLPVDLGKALHLERSPTVPGGRRLGARLAFQGVFIASVLAAAHNEGEM